MLDRPIVLTARDSDDGLVAQMHAQAAADRGSVFRSNVPHGRLAGPCVVVVGDDALAAATSEGNETLSSERGWEPLLGTRFGRAVINVDEPQHTIDRRRWAGAFSPSALARYLPAIDALIARRAERWASQTAFDPYPASREFAFAAVATTLGGFDDDATLSDVLELMSPVLEPTDPIEPPLDRHVRVAPLRDELESILSAQIVRRRACARETQGLVAHLRANEPYLSDDELLAHLNLVLITGHETTAGLLAWLLYQAARDDRLAWLREDVDTLEPVAQTDALHAIEALPRLDAFVHEAARLHPSLVCVPRVAVRDCELAGERIEADTPVALSYGGTNLLASCYDEPLAFRPERWLGRGLPRPATFGAGRRSCIGMRFARMEAKVALAHIVARFDIERLSTSVPANAGFWNTRPRALPQLALQPRRRGRRGETAVALE